MINSNRIVSVTSTDLVTLYGTILKLALAADSHTIAKIDAATSDGQYAMTAGSGNLIASEPVKTFDFGESVSSAVIYFIAAYDYAGFTIAGTAVETAGDEVEADGATLYSATLSSGAVTIAKVSF